MEKIQKTLIRILILAISVALIYVFFAFGGIRSSTYNHDDSGFPFFILFSSWPAIWIPIMVRKREEAREKEENQLLKIINGE